MCFNGCWGRRRGLHRQMNRLSSGEQQASKWHVADVSRQHMAPDVNTYSGHLGTGHTAPTAAAAACVQMN